METLSVHNIAGSLAVQSLKVLKEGTNKIIIQGIVMKKGQVSRNNILYDWNSVTLHCKDLIGRPLLYNHLNESDKAPIGKVIDSWMSADAWWYKADVNPNSEYAQSILRGDLSNVSIQLIAERAVPERGEEGSYTRAFVGDLLELSVVPTPGFIDTSIELALVEAFRKQAEAIQACPQCGSSLQAEDITTSNVPTATKLAKKPGDTDDPESRDYAEAYREASALCDELGESEVERLLIEAQR